MFGSMDLATVDRICLTSIVLSLVATVAIIVKAFMNIAALDAGEFDDDDIDGEAGNDVPVGG